MKSSFGRTFTTLAVMLLSTLLLIGISFQVLVRSYLLEETTEDLKADATVIAELTEAVYADNSFSQRDFALALSISSSVSGADAVICDASGRLLLCANEPFGCEHQGMTISTQYLQQVFRDGHAVSVTQLTGLNEEERHVVSVPIRSADGTGIGIVMVSSPVQQLILHGFSSSPTPLPMH